jgi:hypothetical protein
LLGRGPARFDILVVRGPARFDILVVRGPARFDEATLSALLSTSPDGRWQPAIGDPTLMGWVTVLAYGAAALLAFKSASAVRNDPALSPIEGGLSRFWATLALFLLLLGINKQLDLQTLFTQLARDLALAQGWYAERRRYQLIFIGAVAALGLLGTVGMAVALRRIAAHIWLALLGLGFLVSFVLIRAASFHHVDLFLRAGPVRLPWVFELTGIGLIGLAAARSRRLAVQDQAVE